ncbi:MAG: aminotransferase class I/II-fold pyridoxal phosphate-dependent enzyme [Propionibacteriales bacterium]|nr:aminotransferase class I/II-fold pyridoxal phosphate-dependent enzyme [Propionibacteriales bacterium]
MDPDRESSLEHRGAGDATPQPPPRAGDRPAAVPPRPSSGGTAGRPPAARVPRETRLDSYVDRYATRTHGMAASEIRALFSVASRPEVVSLAGGMPNISGLPLDVVGDLVHTLVLGHGGHAMQYSSGQGEPRLREQICEVMRLEGVEAHPDDVVVTVGSQQAVDLVTRLFCDPGDVVLCEAPSYVGALGVFRAYECEVVHVEMDDDGLRPDALRQALQAIADAGRRAKFLYTIPNYHNPAGVSLSTPRRAEVLEICREADLLVLEDNPYGLLGFTDEPFRALRADDPERVLYLGSFSKTFAPGLRVGWAVAPHAVREKLVLAQESATLCPPTFSQAVVSAYLAGHDWRGQIKAFREMYRERRDAMLESLEDLMPPGTTWTVPQGGFYVWLTLPEGLDAKAMLPRAVTERVAFVPGTAFYADGFGSQCMRLSYCHPTPERIREGVRRLAAVIEQEMQLRETFGAGRASLPTYDTPNPDLT